MTEQKQLTFSYTTFFKYQLTACYTLARKVSVRIFRIWKVTITPPVISISLFCLVFGQILGKKIGGISGVSYLEFIIPGLIMNIVTNESFSNNASTIMIDKFNRSIESLVTSPIHEFTILIGYFLGCLLRVFLAGGVAFLLVTWLSGIMVQDWLLFIYTIFVTTALFSFLGFINGLYASKFDEISLIPTFILTPLSFFGGVFYDITTLPEPWRSLSWYNPVVYILDTFRYSMIGVSLHDVNECLMVVTGVMVILFAACFLLLRSGYGLRN